MWKFIKRIFSDNRGDVTFVAIDEDNPDSTETFHIKKNEAIGYGLLFIIGSPVLFGVLFFATPLNKMYQEQLDNNFRNEVISISNRVQALQDSLIAREVQLNDLKNFVRNVPDTTFSVEERNSAMLLNQDLQGDRSLLSVNTYDMMTREEVLAFYKTERSHNFPSFLPIEGSVTQGFSPSVGHYGIDIASQSGTEFKVVADGVVIYAEWTVSYGYVIFLQHEAGVVSIYKHAATLSKKRGDIVLKGAVLGTVGDRGVMSSGPHLHVEIWVDGIPKNPLFYLLD